MCLYGNDLDEETTPIEAGLTWVIGRSPHAQIVSSGADATTHDYRKGTT